MGRGLRMVGMGCGLAAVGGVGGYGMYQRRLKDNNAITAVEFHERQGANFTSIAQASRNQFLCQANSGLKLYRFRTCPYCGTVKTFLDYFSIPHSVVEVDPMLKTQIKSHGYGKLPQLKFVDGTILVDSDEITSLISAKMGAKTDKEVDHWRAWARDQLSRYIVLALNRTVSDSVKAYNYIDDVVDVPFWSKCMLKAVGGPVMYLVAHYKTKKTLQKEYGFGEADGREVLFQQMDAWMDSFKKGQRYHGGQQPDLADLDVYGILQSAEAAPLYDDIKSNARVSEWLSAMDSVLLQNRKQL